MKGSIHDAICPRLPSCVYAEESQSKGRAPILHVFRSIRQRDGWVDQSPGLRSPTKPTDARIVEAWERLNLVLHVVDSVNLKI